MRREDQIRIRHLTEAASKAVAYSAGKRRIDLDDDELLRLAPTKPVEIVGEAAKNVSLRGSRRASERAVAGRRAYA